MAAETSEHRLTLEFHGALADRFAALGRRRGTRTLVDLPLDGAPSVGALLSRLAEGDPRYGLLFDRAARRLTEHVDVVLNDRVLELRGGLEATLQAGDVLGFLPAHAGG
jgi:molybdopterin converting factor small subunit